ncbi:MAG: hypothetical protein AAB916_00450 [Patescibacteria group bacterium]
MHNWSVDTTELEKDPERYAIWRLEQMVNFGTDGERISAADLRRYWQRLVLDPAKKRFLGFLLWGKEYLNHDK